jgi:hypothetical protein
VMLPFSDSFHLLQLRRRPALSPVDRIFRDDFPMPVLAAFRRFVCGCGTDPIARLLV